MSDVSNLWLQMLEWMTQTFETVRTLDLFILAVLVAPCVLALASLSLTAFLVTVLLVAIALMTFRGGTDETFRWSIAVLTCVAGLLAILQAILLRRRRGYLRHLETVLEETRRELSEVREKYEGEVYWRRAGERVTAEKPSAVDDAGSRPRPLTEPPGAPRHRG
jgi:predicted signal transduction protein with EAL and GGDEF domain